MRRFETNGLFFLKVAGIGQNIAMHASPTARNFFWDDRFRLIGGEGGGGRGVNIQELLTPSIVGSGGQNIYIYSFN